MPAFMKAIMTVRTQQPPGGKGGREGAAACGLDGRRHHPSSAPSRDLPVRYGRERGCCSSAAVAAPAIDDSQEREKVPASREPRDRAKATDNPLLPPVAPRSHPLGRVLARDGPGAGQARGAARRGGDEPARPGSEVGEAGEERGAGGRGPARVQGALQCMCPVGSDIRRRVDGEARPSPLVPVLVLWLVSPSSPSRPRAPVAGRG